MVDDIRKWLEELDLSKYTDLFVEHEIDTEILPDLTEADLKDLGIPLGSRKKLLKAIAALGRGTDRSAGASEDVISPHPTDASTPAGERRQVTVLFADLSGYTKLSTMIDAEEAHALLSRFFDRADGIIRDYGGTVDKHIGDSVMAVFGAPLAHDNDPERAVRAADAIRQAMPDLASKLGRPLDVHIGVASGQVVASGIGGDTHYTVIGDSVNLAARLTDAAGPGEILITAAVERATKEIVDLEDHGKIAVKGLTDPVHVSKVRRIRAASDRRDYRPLIDRHAEVRQFTVALDACLETGVGQVVYLRGEAGIGKTRLLEEFRHLAVDRGFACHRALILDFGVGKGQDPVRTLVRSLLGIPPTSSEVARSAAAKQAAAHGLIDSDHTVDLNDLLDLPQSVEQRALYDAMDNATRNAGKRETVATLARRLSARQPLMVLVDNLHWADELVLDQLAELARQTASCRLLVAMTSRIEGDPLDQAWRASIGGTPLLTMDIGPLGQEDAMTLAASYLDASSQFALSCIERAAGNPLFLEQLLRSAEDGGIGQVPGSVQSLVQARLDNLTPTDKAAAQAASVLGQSFSLEALQHLLANPQYSCAGLVDHHLVRPEGGEFLFTHALVQEGVYGSLLKSRRQELHQRAAEWFAGRDPELQASHLERAGDAQAARAYLEAAQEQIAIYRFERARHLTERGLKVSADRAVTYDLMCQLSEVLRELGHADQSIEAYEQASANAVNDVQKCYAWLGMAEGMRIVDRLDEAMALLARAQPLAEAAGLSEVLMRLHHLRGNLLFPKGDIDGCEAEHQRSLGYAREIGSAEGEARGLGGLGDAAYVGARMRTSHDELSRCVEICRANGLGRVEVANSAQICHTKIYLLQLREAMTLGSATIESARRVGHDRAELNAQVACVFTSIELAEWQQAKEHADRALELVARIGAERFRASPLAFLGRALKAEGQGAEALARAHEAVQSAREMGGSFEGPRVLGCLARITEDPAEQESALEEAESMIAKGCVGHNQLYFYRDAIEVSLERKDWDAVESYAHKLAEFASSEPLPWTEFFIARGRLLAAWGRGERRPELAANLRRLQNEAQQLDLVAAVPAISDALQAA